MPAIFFLSDYGLVDEFAGVVRAVLQRGAPGVPVIDLTHQVPSFDVAAAARVLERAAPHLGPGVVLAVVDPGVGSERRGVALEVATDVGPRWMVGPDNGLLLPAADVLGGARRALALAGASTFDGRDVFAPAAAHLVGGGAPEDLGPPIDVDGLVALPADPVPVSVADGVLTTWVTWVDGYGNVQLAGDLPAWDQLEVASGATVLVDLDPVPADGRRGQEPAGHAERPVPARPVSSFSSLDPGELGLVIDANGRHALVIDRASAASTLGIAGPGTVIRVRVGTGIED
ncbi:MAG TPA: SAM-dependent chlorinase/fluorinase [Acidimicrobiales bacterium]|nr:SAM-dependent chlorinase/fluorinase [Acidimicrobiales bacterium]